MRFFSLAFASAIISAAAMPTTLSAGEIRLQELPGQTALSKKQTAALEYCSMFAKGAFVRALDRERFDTSASAHAAVEKEKPGEETAQEIHKIIELVYGNPDKAPNEIAGIGYSRCMAKFVDDLEGKR